MESRSEPFSYTTLPDGHIRVISPIISTSDQNTAWSIEIVPINDPETNKPPPYNALSYTWGDQSTTYPLVCNGQELRIHYELYIALPYLAQHSPKLPLWVDAICINQADENEKLTQIGQMSKIYRNAIEVWVWLGASPEPYATQALNSIFPRLKEIATVLHPLPPNTGKPLSDFDLPQSSSPVWEALSKILRSPWFKRLWVIQEAVLAASLRLLFGNHTIDYEDLQQAIDQLSSLRSLRDEEGNKLPWTIFTGSDSSFDPAVFYCRSVYRSTLNDTERDRANTIMTIVTFINRLQCTDPRDRVLSLIGLFGEDDESIPKMDLRVPIEQLYSEFLHIIVHNTNSTNWCWLLECAVQNSKNGTFPSWCPDLHNPDLDSRTLHTEFRPSSYFKCSRRGSTYRELILQGVLIDTIEEVGERGHKLNWNVRKDYISTFVENIQTIQNWLSSAANLLSRVSSKSTYSSHEEEMLAQSDHDQRLWETLTYVLPRSYRSSTYEEFCDLRRIMAILVDREFADLLKRARSGHFADNLLQEGNEEAVAELLKYLDPILQNPGENPALNCFTQISNIIIDRTMFITTTGYFGRSFGDIQPQDHLCLFDGCRSLSIIRESRKGSKEGPYKLVGHAQIPGLMNGEVDRMNLQFQDFILV